MTITGDFTLTIARKIPDAEPQPVPLAEPDEWHDWREAAACANTDPEVFFNERDPAPALKCCKRCPVVFDCLSLAESMDSGGLRIGAYGIFGGMTAGQRQEMRKQRGVRLA